MKLEQFLGTTRVGARHSLQERVHPSAEIQREAMYEIFFKDQRVLESRAECSPLVKWAKQDVKDRLKGLGTAHIMAK